MVIINKPWIFYIASMVVVLDFITKFFVRLFSPDILLLPFLSLKLITNTGAAFGIFKGYRLFFIAVAVLVTGFIFYMYPRLPSKKIYIFAAAFVLGGTIGNLIDRIFFGFVTDFIAFSFWPAFNVADASLTIGAVLLLIILFYEK